MTGKVSVLHIEMKVLSGLAERREDSSLCPSEIARALLPRGEPGWRALMPRIRTVVARMAREHQVVVTRGSAVLFDPFEGGPIRIRRGSRFPRRDKP